MQAEEMLEKNAQEGCFLIRDSSKNGMYTLSIFYNSEKLGILYFWRKYESDFNFQYMNETTNKFLR